MKKFFLLKLRLLLLRLQGKKGSIILSVVYKRKKMLRNLNMLSRCIKKRISTHFFLPKCLNIWHVLCYHFYPLLFENIIEKLILTLVCHQMGYKLDTLLQKVMVLSRILNSIMEFLGFKEKEFFAKYYKSSILYNYLLINTHSW